MSYTVRACQFERPNIETKEEAERIYYDWVFLYGDVQSIKIIEVSETELHLHTPTETSEG